MADHWPELRSVIAHAILNQPRSLQTRIGPSGIGNPCSACLLCHFAGVPKTEELPWLSFVGTCVHNGLQDIFGADDRWLVEHEVTVGEINGEPITGHADLYDTATGNVYDWKIVGKSTLDKVRRHPLAKSKPEYHIQRHLYGVGFEAQGFPVNEVVVVFLPRNDISIDRLHIDAEILDPDVATVAMQRASDLHDQLQQVGLEAALDAHGWHNGQSFDCSRFDHDSFFAQGATLTHNTEENE